jgi:hypothetical protein
VPSSPGSGALLSRLRISCLRGKWLTSEDRTLPNSASTSLRRGRGYSHQAKGWNPMDGAGDKFCPTVTPLKGQSFLHGRRLPWRRASRCGSGLRAARLSAMSPISTYRRKLRRVLTLPLRMERIVLIQSRVRALKHPGDLRKADRAGRCCGLAKRRKNALRAKELQIPTQSK